ncbi:MAG TPA: alpha/beta fold hydrolase [Opitutaceae bacterium]|jgi:dienelactone hydrolase|nr:alpha/beta fold hydrolase [Opitutaceae bacterium]
MRPQILLVLPLLCLFAAPVRALTTTERQAYLAWMLKTLPDDPEWNAWQKASGELPPDFDALPRSNALPNPLEFLDGRAVGSAGDWEARRREIWRLMERYQTGTFPPKPAIDRVEVQGESRGAGWVTRNVKLIFGPGGKGSVRVQVTIPDGADPKPVLICTSLGGWGPALVRRGYIAAGFAGNDFMDDEAALKDVYPDYDFAALPRRAWAVQLVIDYLDTLPQVARDKIAIFGYSRDGKMVATAAALDTRIAAVIAGSTGVGGILPWRIAGERGNGEGIETTTRMFPTWFVPRLRFFSGHEDRLPVDGNLLVSLIAPRACLMEYGLNDEVSNSWGSEQTYRSAIQVYGLLGHPERLDILRVPGFHGANDPDACLDWLDMQFGRTARRWTNNFLFPWSFAAWKALSGDRVDLSRFPAHAGEELLAASATPADWEPKAAAIRQSVAWALGTEPPLMPPLPPLVFRGRPMRPPPPGPTVVAEGHFGNPGQLAPDVPAWVIERGGPEFGWLEPQKNAVTSRKFRFGDGVTGDLYLPAGAVPGAKLPTVVWLHGFSYPLGYMWVYRRDLHPILALAQAGYAVLAYDQCGFGSRMGEAGPFYDRFPHWSLMGRMVEDVQQAVGALQKDKQVDPDHIYLYGYTLGAEVGLYAAALDPRIKGVVAVAGFTPMRTDTAGRGTSGVARYAFERGFLPRLGFFVGHEPQIPYDFDGLIGLIAPRPVLVVQPQRDRDATPADVRAAVDRARSVYRAYGADGKLGLAEPDDIARLPNNTLDSSISWMHAHF